VAKINTFGHFQWQLENQFAVRMFHSDPYAKCALWQTEGMMEWVI